MREKRLVGLGVLLLAIGTAAAAAGQAPPAPADDPMRMELAAPIATWDEAVPLGNGMTGGLLWGEGRVIRLSLDRGDLWDLRTPAAYLANDWTYATIKRLVKERNQAELVRRFDAPFEEIAYPTKLPGARLEIQLEEGRSLGAFSLDMRRAVGRADFTGGRAEVFFSAREPVSVAMVRGSHPAFRLVAPASLARLGYPPARTGGDEGSSWIEQEAALGLRYAVHVASRRLGGDTLVAIAISSSREGADPLALARSRTASALARGFDVALREHEAWWRTFWEASSVRVPDPRAQRHYNLVQYFYGAASRRGAPPMPLQGVWTADAGTLPPWKGDFHFDLNVQLSYWPYLQAGHFDEGTPYLDFLWDLVPEHRRFAARFFKAGGIVVPGVMALDGQPLAGWAQYSLSPVQGAWAAHAFYLHWRYTADPHFLSERAYPYCALVGEGLSSLLEPGADLRLRLPLSSSPEIHDNSLAAWMTPMTNYDLSLVRWLFSALDEMAAALGRDGERARWSALLARMDDLAVDEATGVLRVSPTESLTRSHRHLSHLMAIHPLGTLTVEGTAAERRTIAASLDQLESLGTSEWCGYSFSWAAAMAARAARAEDAWKYLDVYLKAFILRNGFHANGDQTRSGYSNFTYRPFTLEGNFAAAQAVHEMLLQSWNGVVRVFPAMPVAWADASFTDLRAEGALSVSAVRAGGRTTEIRIRAARGGQVRVKDPFAGSAATWSHAPIATDGATRTFSLRSGETLVARAALSGR
jgi:alpha-L-fucosidase 2